VAFYNNLTRDEFGGAMDIDSPQLHSTSGCPSEPDTCVVGSFPSVSYTRKPPVGIDAERDSAVRATALIEKAVRHAQRVQSLGQQYQGTFA
jgi:hypothetical protein